MSSYFPHLNPGNQMTFSEKMVLMERLALLPALPLMLNTRSDVGSRLAHPPHVAIVVLAMFIVGFNFDNADPAPFLFMYACYTTAMFLCHRLRRWREFRKGMVQHSYYLGTSPFDFRWLPNFIRRNRKIARFVDPLFFMAVGLFFIGFSPLFGAWLVISAACLNVVENSTHRRTINDQMDIVDGLVSSGVQGQTVERFAEPTASHSYQQDNQGIPTGLGADIQHKINQRRKPSK